MVGEGRVAAQAVRLQALGIRRMATLPRQLGAEEGVDEGRLHHGAGERVHGRHVDAVVRTHGLGSLRAVVAAGAELPAVEVARVVVLEGRVPEREALVGSRVR